MLIERTRPVEDALSRAPEATRAYQTAKRCFDLGVGTALLIMSIPLMIVLAILIRFDSPGPIVFRQKRIGEAGRPFKFYKFRTMYRDARSRFPELYAYQYTEEQIRNMYFKMIDDPRLTPFGRRLRRTSLDELPNLINVVLGDMTLVGPRPELPEMLGYYREDQLPKFSVKPGVTGLAQVSGRGILRLQETITADLEYVRHRSFSFDLLIIVRTIDAVVRRVGAF